jgi:iron-sulfur cluster assembly protein
MLTLTSAAVVVIQKFLEDEQLDPAVAGLRVTVQPGGCSGFKYSLEVAEAPAEDDQVELAEGVRVFMDPFSLQYVEGIEIGYTSSMQGSGFTFKNPNATGGCGCGSSFAV